MASQTASFAVGETALREVASWDAVEVASSVAKMVHRKAALLAPARVL
jgi:hypothetical protein